MISAMPGRRVWIALIGVVGASALVPPATAGAGRAPEVRLDQVQVIGTHNSYHLPPRKGLLARDPINIAQAPLDVQLEEQNVRSFELDAYDAPRFPVFHSMIVDEKTTCPTMRACLEVINEWSREHRRHVPILILVEPKQIPTLPTPDSQLAINRYAREHGISNWDADSLDALDDVVRDVFGRRLLTPDDVRGKYKTLRGAVVDRGWPTLEKSRGKVVVVLNKGGELRDTFLDGHEILQKRAMFVTADAQAPSAAVVKRDDPDDIAEIKRLVRHNFIVRTRSDSGGVQARLNDVERRTDALRSGAHIISTDYPVANPLVGPYVVKLPGGGPVRCNPVNAPEGCRRSALPES